MDGIISFSDKPLQLAMVVGVAVGLFTIAAGLLVLFQFTFEPDNSWLQPHDRCAAETSLILALCLLSGVQLISLGILGQYVARLFEEVKNRPTYIVRTKVNFDQASETRAL